MECPRLHLLRRDEECAVRYLSVAEPLIFVTGGQTDARFDGETQAVFLVKPPFQLHGCIGNPSYNGGDSYFLRLDTLVWKSEDNIYSIGYPVGEERCGYLQALYRDPVLFVMSVLSDKFNLKFPSPLRARVIRNKRMSGKGHSISHEYGKRGR